MGAVVSDHDEKIIVHIANLCGLEQWQLDRHIVQVIKDGWDKYRYYDDIVKYVKTVLNIK